MSEVKAKNDFGMAQKEARRRIADAVVTTTLELEADVKESFTGPKSGRTYKISPIRKAYAAGGKRTAQLREMGVRGRTLKSGKVGFTVGYKIHRASAPGESPAILGGTLAGTIQSDTSKARTDYTGEVTAGSAHAELLEYGTPGGKIRPRPFMGPAARRAEEKLEKRVEKAVEGVDLPEVSTSVTAGRK